MNQPTIITGAVLIGAEERVGRKTFTAVNPASGVPVGPPIQEADARDVADACRLAAEAFPVFSETTPQTRAVFLESIASGITALGDELIERAMLETGLPRGRLEGERARTTGQLDYFARIVRTGAWIDATLDSAQPQRLPQPRPQLRRRHVGLGPVVVFGASNFPLAFSVAGGDTTAALAAGCPVVVKGHPSHPGTGELVARALRAAVSRCGLPMGTFSYLPGASHELGRALVEDPRIQAVGFTGSRRGGLALVHAAAGRPTPIPVYAEMSSINPVILFPAAARARGAELGRAYVASLTLGAGQFCTNPGLVIVLQGADSQAFMSAAAEAVRACPSQPMLAAHIHESFDQGVAQVRDQAGVTREAVGPVGPGQNQGRAVLFSVDAAQFMANPSLAREVFGPASLVVKAQDVTQIAALFEHLEGQLTTTVLFDEGDTDLVRQLLPSLERKAGRILANGWPTGVEVCDAMVHGGPYPATSDIRTTSVGALAMQRFLRPVCYQNFPDSLLPDALRTDNPLQLARRVDGVLQCCP
ncbi:MAG TPA: aldehyde dehydrogenase (NADP(+)) [Steroidobacteraceae bacterium]|nr:aldehyde dehydrogenase (NADP(+)) [Steroidobacteraceae bacterium]